MTTDVYASLTKIAPTIANSGEYASDWFEPWPDQTLMVGTALGKRDEAQRLVDDPKKRFSDEAAAHPQFAGVPAISCRRPTTRARDRVPGRVEHRLPHRPGPVIPKELTSFASEEAQAYIPVEKLDARHRRRLDLGQRERRAEKELAENKLFGQLQAVKAGRSLYSGSVLAGAIYLATVQSLPYVLDTLVPELETVLPG